MVDANYVKTWAGMLKIGQFVSTNGTMSYLIIDFLLILLFLINY